MGILELWTLVNLVLKVTDTDGAGGWGWWFVFAPLWVGYGIGFILWLIGVLVFGVALRHRTTSTPRRVYDPAKHDRFYGGL
jgi:hypothetical protein